MIHYCQNYRQGDWLFAKRRVPKGAALTWPPATNSILHCTHPLLAEPPQNLSRVLSYATNDGGTKPLRPREAARVNFVLRTATHGVNAALARFKMDVCLSKSNVKENTLRSHPAHLAYALVVPVAQARDRLGREAPRFAPIQGTFF